VTRVIPWFVGVALVAVLLALGWWGWHRVGLGVLQLGMTC